MSIPKVLLVNDDPASLFALENLLADSAQQHGYQLLTAGSGQEALRQVLRHDFAVILLDVSMPDMDGFETAEAIHSNPRSAGVPIIFITAHYADEMNRLKAYQKGAVDYLFTPVIPQILQTKVEVFVAMTKQTMLLREKSAQLARLNEDLRVQRVQELERINQELAAEVRERKRAEQRAHELSTRDSLTNLVNRRSLIQQLEHAVASADRHGSQFALLFLDLDKFKEVNDHYGHEVGDELLRQVAARLTAAVRVSDVVARLGGDEFVVLIEGERAAANAARVARKIEQAGARPYVIGNHRIHSAPSVGIALYPQDGDSAQTLMRNADLAMYQAKQDQGCSIRFFHEELNARERERERWTRELRQALEEDQLELRYQPQVALETGEVHYAEALLYWRHPRLGLIPAPQFLPCVPERALLDRLDAWVIASACAQVASWRQASPPAPLGVAFNLTAPHLEAELAQQLLPTLRRHRLGAGSVTLELSETLLPGADAGAQALLRQLREAGVRLALDHFGSAHSSLATCKQLRFDALKIDRAFVHAIGREHGGSDIVAAMIHLARALAMQVVALGVNHEQQLEQLRAQGCDYYQGELYCQPMPPAELIDHLHHAGAAGQACAPCSTHPPKPRGSRP